MPLISIASDETNTIDSQNLISTLGNEIQNIQEPRWRNFAYRDFAESLAFNGDIDAAISIIDKIDSQDTKAMTIRAIGMVLAIHKDLNDDTYRMIFDKLADKATTIEDEGARDIAYTYIAMAQAFAGLNDDAIKTTVAMVNPALKYKAFGETAEIQAERGDFESAIKTINLIDSISFKNKSLETISKIFVEQNSLKKAQILANQITNPTKKASAIQTIFNTKIGLNDIEKQP